MENQEIQIHVERATTDDERMTRERFEAWADEIALTDEQRDRVWYVINREWFRGRVFEHSVSRVDENVVL